MALLDSISPLRAIAFFSLTLILHLFLSCKPDSIHQDLIIEGNTPPTYSGVSEVDIITFVNRLYIDLIGRGPTETERIEALASLKESDISTESIQTLIIDLQERYEFFKNYDIRTKSKLLNGFDSLRIAIQVVKLTNMMNHQLSIGDTLNAGFVETRRDDMEALRIAGFSLYNKEINIQEYIRRHLANDFYNEINMGSENFVLSCFENLFYREPTTTELVSAIEMVDGNSGSLFLNDGSSKQEFVQIAVESESFLEGLVIELYTRLLAREPTSIEMAEHVLTISESLSSPSAEAGYLTVEQQIIKTSEYVGFE